MKFIPLNKESNGRYGYYFDQQLVRHENHTKVTPRKALFLCALALISLAWVPVERAVRSNWEGRHFSAKMSFYSSVRDTELERRRIYRIISSHDSGLTLPVQWQVATLIMDLAQQYDLDPNLVLAVIKTESRFNNRAVSVADARGLMQIMPAVGDEFSRRLNLNYRNAESLFDPILNVKIGTYYLAQLINRFDGDMELALLAYNRGPTDVRTTLQKGSFFHSNYAKKVLENYRDFLDKRRTDLATLSRQPASLAWASPSDS